MYFWEWGCFFFSLACLKLCENFIGNHSSVFLEYEIAGVCCMPEGLTDMQNSLEVQNLLYLLRRIQWDGKPSLVWSHPWAFQGATPGVAIVPGPMSGFVLESAIWRSSKQSCGVSWKLNSANDWRTSVWIHLALWVISGAIAWYFDPNHN